VLRNGYKYLGILLVSIGLCIGLLGTFPRVGDLGQTSRNLFFHVPMWFSMYLMMLYSVIASIRYLRTGDINRDLYAKEAAGVGVLFGMMGLTTGIVWSRVTWGQLLPDDNPSAWWFWDPQQTMAVVAIMIYLAYFVLRSAIDENNKRAQISAVYNIFAAFSLIPLTIIVPRAIGGLHPGSDNSPVFDSRSMSNDYRFVFYPTVLGFMLLGTWLVNLRWRIEVAFEKWTQLNAESS
jgi:heme exporter protein C